MSANDYVITVQTPFPRIDVPSLYIWLERRWNTAVGEDVPTDLDEWVEYQFGKMNHVQTWGAYKNGILGGYIEAGNCEASQPLPQNIVYVSSVFREDFWGIKKTGWALRLVLYELFMGGVEMVVFPVLNQGLKQLYSAIGASNIGIVPNEVLKRDSAELYVLPVAEWERKNEGFLSEHEGAELAEAV